MVLDCAEGIQFFRKIIEFRGVLFAKSQDKEFRGTPPPIRVSEEIIWISYLLAQLID